MFNTLKILWNSLKMAVQELRVNKLRTSLSLLGITIGIFCIIAVFTVTDSLERNIRSEVQSLGSDVIYVQKWPWSGDESGEYPWWKYMNRPEPAFKEVKLIQDKVQSAGAVAFLFSSTGKKVEYGDDYMEGVELVAVTQDADKIISLSIAAGRYFAGKENDGVANVAVVGAKIWEGLFGDADVALGKTIRIAGRPCTIVGLLKKKGSSLVGGGINNDNSVLLPYKYARTIVDERRYADPFIMVKAKEGAPMAQMRDELKGALRAAHHLRPREDDDFSMNEITAISGQLNSLFGMINISGGVIAIFALLVGGFGIANIMFVTVKERTNIIGLKKAIGAKRSIILLEFLLEAMMLCVIGGAIGLLCVYLITLVISGPTLEITLTLNNIIKGLTISAVVGMIAGFTPAYFASKLDPVVAIRSN